MEHYQLADMCYVAWGKWFLLTVSRQVPIPKTLIWWKSQNVEFFMKNQRKIHYQKATSRGIVQTYPKKRQC